MSDQSVQATPEVSSAAVTTPTQTSSQQPQSAQAQPQSNQPSPQSATQQVTDSQAASAVKPDGTLATPAWSPNYKVKALDKEFEIPENFRALIKDQDSEKQVREIFEKAYGLDLAKPRYQQTQEQLKTVQSTHEALTGELTQVGEHIARNDFDSAFQVMGIPQEKVIEWVLEKARLQQMEPSQRQQIESQKQVEQRAWQLEKQNQELQQKYQEQLVSQTQNQLQMITSRSDVSAVASEFDARVGQQGAFMNEVIRRAAWMEQQGQHVTPELAVSETIRGLGLQAVQNTPQVPVAKIAPPVIPNISGKGGSPAKRIPRSLDDIRQLAKTMQ